MLLLLLQVLYLYWATRTTATGVRYSYFLDSDLKLIGTLMLVTVVASRHLHQGQGSWTAADPRPADAQTPAVS